MEDGTSTSPGSFCDTAIACEARELLDRLGDKWSLLTLELLADGTLRFMELHRKLGAISKRMLAVTLRKLERDGSSVERFIPTSRRSSSTRSCRSAAP